MRSLRAGSLRLATPSSMASYSRFSRCSTSAVRLFSSACWQLDRVNGLRCAMGQGVQQGVGVEDAMNAHRSATSDGRRAAQPAIRATRFDRADDRGVGLPRSAGIARTARRPRREARNTGMDAVRAATSRRPGSRSRAHRVIAVPKRSTTRWLPQSGRSYTHP